MIKVLKKIWNACFLPWELDKTLDRLEYLQRLYIEGLKEQYPSFKHYWEERFPDGN